MILKSISALVLVMMAVGANAQTPSDIVPRGSGVYEALALLSSHGVLPKGSPDAADLVGVGSRLYHRVEMMNMIDNITSSSLSEGDASALQLLRHYLNYPAQSFTSNAGEKLVATGVLNPEAGVITNNNKSDKWYAEGYGTLRVLGNVDTQSGYVVGWSNRFRQTQSYPAFTTLNGGTSSTNNPSIKNGIEEAYFFHVWPHGVKWTAGVFPDRWGPGASGSLLINDTAPSKPGIEVDFPFKLFRHAPDMHYTQFQKIYSNAGKVVTIAARRIEIPMGSRLNLDIQEACAANRLRNPAFLALPYYAYQRLFIHNNSKEPNEFNYNATVGLYYQYRGAQRPDTIYSQFMIDDIQAPQGFGLGNRVPRKIAYLAGINHANIPGGTDVALEYIHSDATTFTKPVSYQTPLAWFMDSLPIGHPIGPNGNELYCRVGQKLGRTSLAVEGRKRVKVSSNQPAPDTRSLDMSLSYHINGSNSISLRYADYREDPYNGPAGDPSAIQGGQDYGMYVRQHLYALSYMIMF